MNVHEGISHDPEGNGGISLDSDFALAILDTNDVDIGGEDEGGTVGGELDLDVGQGVDVGAVGVDSSDHLQEGINAGRVRNDERSSSIDDGAHAQPSEGSRASRGVVSVDSDEVQVNLCFCVPEKSKIQR